MRRLISFTLLPSLLTTLAAGPAATQVAVPPLADHPRVTEALRVLQVWLEAQRAYEQIPGLSAAVVHDQEIVWSGAEGLAHPERGVAATPGTIYSICSISKLFTGVAVMQLRDQGVLALSDPVADHLTWFGIRQAHEGSPPVTVAGLLTHAAGLPRESDHPYWSAPDFTFPTREEIVERLAGQETLYPAWRYYQYSNLGLTLAGELVSERTGVPFEQYVQERILDPLDLADTRPYMPQELWGDQLATGYSALTRDGRRERVPFFHARGIGPAAGFSSTATDLARFAAWQFRLQGNTEEVLHAHTLREMQRVHWVDPEWEVFRGLAFGVVRSDGTTFVGHGGSCPGYQSQLLLQMDDRIATIFLANASGVDAFKYARGAYRLLAPALKEAAAGDGEAPHASTPPRRGADRPDVGRYLGTYESFPWGGEIAVVRWKDGLAVLSLPTNDPLGDLARLEHVDGHTFRRVRSNDELGEPVTFETDPAGRVTAILWFENRYPIAR
jgi:CubicO group peptidase (beta-lactamase class C family)